MTLRSKLGLYGPNKPSWSPDTYRAIERSGVSWVVWRTNADPHAPRKLREIGVRVIAQAPDRFNANPWLHPGALADEYIVSLNDLVDDGTPFVFDNESNLFPKSAGRWHAEQWTRYARAFMAHWRWRDPGGLYPLILPALAVGPDRNGVLWNDVQAENIREADGVGAHAYWQHPMDRGSAAFGAPWNLIDEPLDDKGLYILEYGSTAIDTRHEDHLDEYGDWLRRLPPSVRCAALFILDPTSDWQALAVTEPVIEWLAALRD